MQGTEKLWKLFRIETEDSITVDGTMHNAFHHFTISILDEENKF